MIFKDSDVFVGLHLWEGLGVLCHLMVQSGLWA